MTIDELIALWRKTAKELRENEDLARSSRNLVASVYETCADELEEAD